MYSTCKIDKDQVNKCTDMAYAPLILESLFILKKSKVQIQFT